MSGKPVRNERIGVDAMGRRTQSGRLSFSHGLGRLRISPAGLLAGISLVLLAAAGAVYYDIYHQGDTADKNAKELLTEYNQAVSARPAATENTSATPATQSPGASPTPLGSTAPGDYVQPSAPDADPASLAVSLKGYDVIGKLSIAKIGVDLPVIRDAHWTDAKLNKALKVSVCWYEGVLPGEQGNMVITGHNYANGAHFGKLDKLAKGDTVVFSAPDGKAYTYTVTALQTVTPDNADAPLQTSGGMALTLVTCESSGNRRLIVRCALANP